MREAVRKRRPLLVNAGLALAPDAFQTVLDADSTVKGLCIFQSHSWDFMLTLVDCLDW